LDAWNLIGVNVVDGAGGRGKGLLS
jgi:hypothetical protein